MNDRYKKNGPPARRLSEWGFLYLETAQTLYCDHVKLISLGVIAKASVVGEGKCN